MDNLFCQIKGTYFFTQAQHSRWTYRKLIDPHAKKQFGQGKICP